MMVLLMTVGFFAALAAVVCALMLEFPTFAVLIAYPVGGMAGVLAAVAVTLTVPTLPQSIPRLSRQG